MSEPFDPGLQPERSALAWQRTAMAIGVGALVYGRIVAHTLGLWSLLPSAAGLLLAVLMGVKSHLRYRHHHRTLTEGQGQLADGLLPAIVAASVFAAGVFALVVLLLTHIG